MCKLDGRDGNPDARKVEINSAKMMITLNDTAEPRLWLDVIIIIFQP
jgi:hypothetical protein